MTRNNPKLLPDPQHNLNREQEMDRIMEHKEKLLKLIHKTIMGEGTKICPTYHSEVILIQVIYSDHHNYVNF